MLSARQNLGQAIALANNNGNPIKIIKLINRAGKKLHKVDRKIIEHHVFDCVIKKGLLASPQGISEIIKAYRYRS
jgi:DNA-binding FrmR family transcriptional regulator